MLSDLAGTPNTALPLVADPVAAFHASPDQSLHTCPVVAKVANVSEAKLERDRWLHQGIPFVRIGRNVRYRKRDVVAYLDRHTVDFGD